MNGGDKSTVSVTYICMLTLHELTNTILTTSTLSKKTWVVLIYIFFFDIVIVSSLCFSITCMTALKKQVFPRLTRPCGIENNSINIQWAATTLLVLQNLMYMCMMGKTTTTRCKLYKRWGFKMFQQKEAVVEHYYDIIEHYIHIHFTESVHIWYLLSNPSRRCEQLTLLSLKIIK